MSFLNPHRHEDAAADDIEAYAAGGQANPSASNPQGISGGNPGEHGEHIKFGEQIKQPMKSSDLGEFEALDRFITTYDHERRSSLASSSRLTQRPKWWQFWKSDQVAPGPEIPAAAVGKPPDSWLDTDIHQGITDLQVQERRRRFGWNELVSEKENMIAKIFGYFTGPIYL